MNSIYLDHNATTPVHPKVLEAMLPFYGDSFGNPSSSHSKGREARVKMDEAREQVAALLQAHPGEIVFTSGGTESDNMAVYGVAQALRGKGNHILTCKTEHPAILNACAELARQGFEIDTVSVDRYGKIDLAHLQEVITEKTILITIQHANSEVGTLQPIQAIGELARERGVLFHTDAVQSVAKIPVQVADLPVDMLSLSSHKMYGPKGVGALYIKKGCPALVPLVAGGGQEKKRRGGTENVPAIVGFGVAADIARVGLDDDSSHLKALRKQLIAGIQDNLAGVEFFGHPDECLPNTVSLGFEGVEGQTLMIRLDLEGICVSTGTACSSGSISPSDGLRAMQVAADKINQIIRISLGRNNTEQEIHRVVDCLKRLVGDIRQKVAVVS
ncbi:MAG: cysteine desulfurase [Nitrospina sp.]|nr:MAG: cysteine desulfurase [Nitrospina sp.]